MIKVLRLEHNDGSGIFTSYINGEHREYNPWSVACHEDVSSRHQQFKDPYKEEFSSDIYVFIEGLHFCAYKSIEQFQDWIHKDEFAQYYAHGIKAYILELSDCFIGIDQVLFKKSDVISKTDVSELFI